MRSTVPGLVLVSGVDGGAEVTWDEGVPHGDALIAWFKKTHPK